MMHGACSLAGCGRFSPFWEIKPQVAYKLPGCQALRRQQARCAAFAVSAYCSGRTLLGCHRKAPRNRITHLLPKVAAPAVAGVAAAVCLAPQALADPAPAAHTAGRSATVADAIMSRDDTLAAVKRAAHTAAPARGRRPVRGRRGPGQGLARLALPGDRHQPHDRQQPPGGPGPAPARADLSRSRAGGNVSAETRRNCVGRLRGDARRTSTRSAQGLQAVCAAVA